MKKFLIILILLNIKYFAQNPKENHDENKPTHYIKLNHGYSFNIIGAWKEADKATLQQKNNIDKAASGKNLNYDYVFSENSTNISYPFIVVSPLFAGKNYFEIFKKEYVAKFDPTIIKYKDTLSTKISDINFNENSTIINEKDKSITSIVTIKSNNGE